MKKTIIYLATLVLVLAISNGCKKPIDGGYDKETITVIVSGNSVTFKTIGIGEMTVDWGDGTVSEPFPQTSDIASYSHSYTSGNEHTITISGTVIHFYIENVTSIDVSNNNMLVILHCSGNFTSLDLSKNTRLKELYCSNAKLTSLDVSKCTSLTSLNCRDNNLTHLDVSKCTLLKLLDCGSFNTVSGNKLTSLDVSKCNVLQNLNCNSNNFSASGLNELFEMLHGNPIGDKRVYIALNPGALDCDMQIAIEKGWRVYN